jgi:iron(III) transport system permease protein
VNPSVRDSEAPRWASLSFGGWLLGLPLWAWLAVFVLYPLVSVLLTSAGESYWEILVAPHSRRAIVNTLALGATVAVLATTVAFLYAYTVTRIALPKRVHRLLHFIALIPTVTPPFVFGVSLILLFGRRGLVTHTWLGLRGVDLYGFPGLVIVQVLAFFPYAYLLLRSLLLEMDPTLDEAGIVYGGTPFYVMRHITVRLLLPGCASAVFLVFTLSTTDLGNPMFIGGDFMVLTSQIYVTVIGLFNLKAGSVLAVVLLIPCLILLALQKYVAARESYATVGERAARPAMRTADPWIRLPLAALSFAMAAFVIVFYLMIVVGASVKIWGVNYTLTFEHFRRVLFESWMLGTRAVVDTMLLGAIGAVVGSGIGLVGGYLVTYSRVPGRHWFDLCVTLPMAVPGILMGLGFSIAFNQRPLLLAGTAFIIVAIFLVRTVPYSQRAVVAAIMQVHKSLREASTMAGATELQTFLRVVFPMIRPAVLAGIIFNFTRNITTLSGVIFVVSPRWRLLTAAMLAEVETGRIGGAASLGTLLIVVVWCVNLLGYLLFERKNLRRLGA